MGADAPYPELKKTHTMARTGRPWRDVKPPPSAPVWAVIQGYGNYWVLVAAIELGVFDTLQATGPTTVGSLAERLGASPPHLASLLDALVVLGLLEQVRDVYSLNETAERYLTTDGPASMTALVAVAPGPLDNWTRLADTVRTGRAVTPIERDAAGFYRPLVRATYPTQFRVAMFTAFRIGWPRTPGAPRILDLGAGAAPWSMALLTHHPDATAVVNDLPGVIDLAAEKAAALGFTERVELRPGDFRSLAFEPQGYDLVVLGHVCRTEGEQGAPALIRRAFDALRPGGRLLLADYFADNTRKFNPFGVLMGTTMMASTERGFCFTHERFQGWLAGAGFRPVRLLEPIAFNQVYVATRPG